MVIYKCSICKREFSECLCKDKEKRYNKNKRVEGAITNIGNVILAFLAVYIIFVLITTTSNERWFLYVIMLGMIVWGAVVNNDWKLVGDDIWHLEQDAGGLKNKESEKI